MNRRISPRMVRRATAIGAFVGAGLGALAASHHALDLLALTFAGAVWGAALVLTATGVLLPAARRSSRGRRAS